MKYKFPEIRHINDVLPAIEGNDAFKVTYKDDYTVITYLQLGNDTFPDVVSEKEAILRECRGLIFYPDGKLMSRPFHKFFNLGERVETTNIEEDIEYVTEKLDGSMIRPLDINGTIRLATKAGITDVAMQAEYFIADKPYYIEFMKQMLENELTPIFEWCSRKQKIVIDYPEDKLELLSIRDNLTGEYIQPSALLGISIVNHVPLAWFKKNDYRQLENIEGFVLHYPGGHKAKAKADWYVTLHRAKDAIRFEKDVVKLILDEKLDDLMPVLSAEDKLKVSKYVDDFKAGFIDTSLDMHEKFYSIFNVTDYQDRKAFALKVNALDPKYKSFMFGMYDGKQLHDLLKTAILKCTSSRNNVEQSRWMFKAKFEEVENDLDR